MYNAEGSVASTLFRMNYAHQTSLLRSSCSTLLTEFVREAKSVPSHYEVATLSKVGSCACISNISPSFNKADGNSCLRLTELVSLLQNNLSQENLNSASSL